MLKGFINGNVHIRHECYDDDKADEESDWNENEVHTHVHALGDEKDIDVSGPNEHIMNRVATLGSVNQRCQPLLKPGVINKFIPTRKVVKLIQETETSYIFVGWLRGNAVNEKN